MSSDSWAARVLLVVAALSGGSCASLEQVAPPVESLAVQARTGSTGQLVQGREIYVTKCAKCHRVEPVRKYPANQWENEILPEMAEESKLTAGETAAVRAYVMSVLGS
jgi:mono/diheme cytochrome c family protein